MLVLVNAMIPLPGETPGRFWGNTGAEHAREEAAQRGGYDPTFDLQTYFLHDVPEDVARAGEPHQRPEVQTAFTEPCTFSDWPNVPTHIVIGTEDRFFPADFQKRVAKERLDRPITELHGGHLVALSNPEGTANTLLTYARTL